MSEQDVDKMVTDQELRELSEEELDQLEGQLDGLSKVANESWELVKELIGNNADNTVVKGVAKSLEEASNAASMTTFEREKREREEKEE